MAESMRADVWVWAVRVYPTRSAATAGCRAGHVRVNGDRAKAAQPVRIGDEVRVRRDGHERTLVVRGLIAKRVSAAIAAENYTDLTPPPPPRVERPTVAVRDAGAGRPTKRDRRELERLRRRAPER
ncbi:MAG: RNA-binding S4 domain-containing protein [Cryobacterium sp.]|nr:RNA-binding S4 domain-containing protein [Cryobacterium sp.]